MFIKKYEKLKDYTWLSRGFLGKTFKLCLKDFESLENENLYNSIENFLKNLRVEDYASFSLFSSVSYDSSFDNKRRNDLKKVGFVKKRLFFNIFSQKKTPLFCKKSEIFEQMESINQFSDSFLELKPIFIKSFFKKLFNVERLKLEPFGFSNKDEVLGILKLHTLSSSLLDLKNLIFLTERLPLPFEYHIKIKKIDKFKQRASLSRQTKQEAREVSQESFLRYQATQEALCDMELRGNDFFQFEVHVVLRRDSKRVLRNDLLLSQKELTLLGDFHMETVGAFSSFLSLLPAHSFHVPLICQDRELGCFLPLFTRGVGGFQASKSSLIYHRVDQSLDEFNPFHKDYDNYCGVVIGKSGRGKSVFTNLLLGSLSYDQSLKVILVDVKGSYQKRIKELEGQTYNISVDKSCALDPFRQLTNKKESIEIILSFLKSLIAEKLSPREESNLERSLIEYASQAQTPSLEEFVKTLKSFQKIHILERWTKGSLKENIFSNSDSNFELKNLNYFNFSEIMTAQDRDTSLAVMSAVMSEFSHQLLEKEDHDKLIFIVDETPFFIQHSFETFKLLSKNVRKLNASLLLIAQVSSDLILGGDRSLIDNSEFKVLFSLDDQEKVFQQRFSLREEEMEVLKQLRTKKGEYSQFLLKDSLCSKVGFLRLSDKEYIQVTTNPKEFQKLNTLKKMYPFYSDETLSQAFRFLERLS